MEKVESSSVITLLVFFAERIVVIPLTFCLVFIGDGTLNQDLAFPLLALVVIPFAFTNIVYCLEAPFHYGRSSQGQWVVEMFDDGKDKVAFRLDWYPAECFAFWAERFVMLLVTVCTLILYNDELVNHRVLQIPSLIVFPASNLLYLLASYPNLLKLDTQEETYATQEEKTVKEAEFVNKYGRELVKSYEECKDLMKQNMQLIRELALEDSQSETTYETDSKEIHESESLMPEEELREFCSLLGRECMRFEKLFMKSEEECMKYENLFNKSEEECKNLKEENVQLNLEVTAAKTRCDDNCKLLIRMIKETMHAKCREEMNQLIAELNAATASSQNYRHLLHDLDFCQD